MLPYIYHPILFEIGPIKIFTWGLIVAIAFLVSVYLAVKEAKRIKVSKKRVYDLAFYIILGALIGSRLIHVIENFSLYSTNLLKIFEVWTGGLSFYGGLFGALIFALFYIKKNNLNFWKYADLITPSAVGGYVIGRIACLIGDGGHVGKLTTMPWGVLVNGELRHLTALYSLINLAILFIVVTKLKKKKLFTGFLFLFFLIWYSATRFVIDFFRIDPTYYGLTVAQIFSIFLFLISTRLTAKKWKGTK